MVTFGLQLFVFVPDFPLNGVFLSAPASRSVLLSFFFLSVVHACASLASSQALPALKIAVDDECSGNWSTSIDLEAI